MRYSRRPGAFLRIRSHLRARPDSGAGFQGLLAVFVTPKALRHPGNSNASLLTFGITRGRRKNIQPANDKGVRLARIAHRALLRST